MRLLDRIFIHLRRALQYKVFWLGGPILLYVWTITGPLLSDDLHLLLKSERYHRGETKNLDLYRFASNDAEWNELRSRGACPWWVPSGRLDFFRPVSERMFYLDTLLFGRNVIGYRLMSLAVFAIALLAVHWMVRCACSNDSRAAATTFFFGISQTAAPPVTWMCNRQDLLVLLGVSLAGGAYWLLRNQGALKWLLLAVVAYVFALLSKEVAIAMCGVVVLHELIIRRKQGQRWLSPRCAALACLLIAITGCYIGYYLSTRPWVLDLKTGQGVPSQLSGNWPMAILLYFAVWTTGFPIDALLAGSSEQSWAVAAIGGALSIIAIAYLRRSTKGDRAALFFGLWAILFMLPALRALTASTRSLCVATVGWSYLLTGLILPAKEEDVVIPSPLRHWYYTVNGVVSIGCAIGTVLFMNRAESDARRRMEEVVASCRPSLASGHSVVITNAESAAEAICSGDRLEYLTGFHGLSVTHLLPSGVDATMEPMDEQTLIVRAKQGSLFASMFHQLTLPHDWRPREGQMYTLRDYTVEIAEVRGIKDVTALRVHLNEPLSSPRLHFYPPMAAPFAKAAGETVSKGL